MQWPWGYDLCRGQNPLNWQMSVYIVDEPSVDEIWPSMDEI